MIEQPEKQPGDGIAARMTTLKAARDVSENARRDFVDDPNIQGIGYGLKYKDGKPTGELAVTFHVRRKVRSLDAIRALGSRPIPAALGGVPTDVLGGEIAADFTGERDEKRFDPLLGGIGSSNAEENILWFNSGGTLGTLCFKDGAAMALSNWHVWADGGDKGDDIIQPGHPNGQHLEGLAKVAFCGPLLGSLFEWEAPSPLTWGLYGGAAAAALAAALSDVIDPTRRGQQATPTTPGERTLGEQVEVKIHYPQQPIPGTPYSVEVAWDYRRKTDLLERTYSVKETNTNPHVLLFKQLWSDQPVYKPGSRVRLFARIGAAHPRPCDSYYVVAHYIADADPQRLVSCVLRPISCDGVRPPEPGGELTCVDFAADKPGTTLPPSIQRGQVRFEVPTGDPNRVVDFDHDGVGELYLHDHLLVSLPVSSRVEATLICGVSRLAVEGYQGNTRVAQATPPNNPGQSVTVVLEANAIDRVVFRRAQWECSLVRLCYVPVAIQPRPEAAAMAAQSRRLCCYTGELHVPVTVPPTTWKGYLLVQTINDVPAGTSPEVAAQTIGGLPVSQNFVPNLVGCGALLAADHLFDII